MTRSWQAKCGSEWQTPCARPMQGPFPLPEPSILALLLICLMKMKRLCETVCNLFLGPRYELWWMYRTINYLFTLAIFQFSFRYVWIVSIYIYFFRFFSEIFDWKRHFSRFSVAQWRQEVSGKRRLQWSSWAVSRSESWCSAEAVRPRSCQIHWSSLAELSVRQTPNQPN